jgi:hypothetical protein
MTPAAPRLSRRAILTALMRARLSALTHRRVPGGIMAGCHDGAFWGRHWPTALEFISAHQPISAP